MSNPGALVPTSAGPPAVQRAPCASCQRPIDLSREELAGRRARCPHCGQANDVLAVRSPDAGPLRSFDEIRLVADPAPPPEQIQDLILPGRTRDVRVANLDPKRPFKRTLAVIAAGCAVVVTLIGTMGLRSSLTTILILLVNGTVAVRDSMRLREDVYIENGRLYRRASGKRIGFTRSVSLDDVIDVEIVRPKPVEFRLFGRKIATYERLWTSYLAVRLRRRWWNPFRQQLPITWAFKRSEEDLIWLRDHLRAGIALARDDRGAARPMFVTSRGREDGPA